MEHHFHWKSDGRSVVLSVNWIMKERQKMALLCLTDRNFLNRTALLDVHWWARLKRESCKWLTEWWSWGLVPSSDLAQPFLGHTYRGQWYVWGRKVLTGVAVWASKAPCPCSYHRETLVLEKGQCPWVTGSRLRHSLMKRNWDWFSPVLFVEILDFGAFFSETWSS